MMLTILFLLQHTSLNPDGKLLIIVGDYPEGMVIDANSGKVKHKFNPSFPVLSKWVGNVKRLDSCSQFFLKKKKNV
jgi:hypothetical protein